MGADKIEMYTRARARSSCAATDATCCRDRVQALLALLHFEWGGTSGDSAVPVSRSPFPSVPTRERLRARLRARTRCPQDFCAGEFSPGETARFYRIARRSATECIGVLDVGRALGIGDAPELDVGDELLYRIVSMLTKMIVRAAPVG